MKARIHSFAGMTIIESPYLPPGQMLAVADDFLNGLLSLKPLPMDLDPKPYDKSLVPPGHEPALMVSDDFEWLRWGDRVRMNNWLIETFGTRPQRLRPKLSFTPELKINPASVFGALTS